MGISGAGKALPFFFGHGLAVLTNNFYLAIHVTGKTSLLHILSGRSQSNKKLTIQSDIRMNNLKVDPSSIEVRKQIAFVTQDDALQPTSTPREAMFFSAKLRLPRITSDDEIKELTEKMITELGLEECADTMIGGELVKGISGGERKRTSIGVELVTKPCLVFLDGKFIIIFEDYQKVRATLTLIVSISEPTSGLDIVSALEVINVLKKIAHSGSSVMLTIHAPPSDVFASFDNLILLNRGLVMYQGSVDKCPEYFSEHSYSIPEHYNPADWIMTIAQKYSQEMMVEEQFFISNQLSLPAADLKNGDELQASLRVGKYTDAHENEWRHVSFMTEVRLLFTREFKNIARNKLIRARFGLTTFISLLVGCIFFGVGSGQDINSHFGAMVMMLMISMFSTALPTLVGFSDERPVFLREYSTNHYSVVSYFISKLFMEASITLVQIMEILVIVYFMVDLQGPFYKFAAIEFALAMSSTATAVLVGCSVGDPKIAIEFMPVLFLPQILFSGLFVRTELIPEWLRWAQYLCALMYAVRLALLAEFGDCASISTSPMPNPCANLLEANMVEEDQKAIYWAVLWGLFLVFRLSGLVVLRKKATKFYD